MTTMTGMNTMDRNMMAGGMMGSGMPMPAAGGMPGMMPMNMMMIPRCTMTMEKMANGMKMTCRAQDKMATTMMQQMCMMMQGGMCSLCCMTNGMMMCTCNMTMGTCKMEMTEDGVMMTCTSGDEMCAKMIHACCDCMMGMMKAGCCCCMMINGMPMCMSC